MQKRGQQGKTIQIYILINIIYIKKIFTLERKHTRLCSRVVYMVVVVANENHPQKRACMLVLRVMGGGGGRRAQPPSRTSVGGSFLGVEGVVMLPKSLHPRE